MNFLRGFSFNTACTFLVFSLGFVNSMLLADHLGRAQYGALKVWTVIVMLGGLLCGEWLNKGSAYVVGREQARDAAISHILLYSLALVLALLLITPLCLQVATSFLPSLTPTRWLLGMGLIVLTVLQKAGLSVLLGEDRIKLYALLPVIFIATYLGGNLLFSQWGVLGLEQVMQIWLAAIGVSVVAVYGLFFHAGFRFTGGNRRIFRQMLAMGMRGEIALALIFLLLKSDVVLVNYFLGKEAVGVYGVATNFTDMMQRVPNIASVVLFAKVVRGQDNGRLSLRVAQGTFIFSFLTAIGYLLLGRQLLDLFFPQYPDAYIPLVWLLPGMLFSGFGAVLNAKLIGAGYPPVTMWAPGIALSVNMALNLWLIPAMGLRGAALSTSIAYALWGSLIASHYLRRAQLGWRDILSVSSGGKNDLPLSP